MTCISPFSGEHVSIIERAVSGDLERGTTTKIMRVGLRVVQCNGNASEKAISIASYSHSQMRRKDGGLLAALQ